MGNGYNSYKNNTEWVLWLQKYTNISSYTAYAPHGLDERQGYHHQLLLREPAGRRAKKRLHRQR